MTTTRTFVHQGKRIHLHLEPAVWQVIDWQAAYSGSQWGEMVSSWLAVTGKHDTNTTRVIRTTALQKLADDTIFAVRQDRLQPSNTLSRTSHLADDTSLKEALRTADILSRNVSSDYDVLAGLDDKNRVTFYIKNRSNDCLNLIISTPFSLTQWSAATSDTP